MTTFRTVANKDPRVMLDMSHWTLISSPHSDICYLKLAFQLSFKNMSICYHLFDSLQGQIMFLSYLWMSWSCFIVTTNSLLLCKKDTAVLVGSHYCCGFTCFAQLFSVFNTTCVWRRCFCFIGLNFMSSPNKYDP